MLDSKKLTQIISVLKDANVCLISGKIEEINFGLLRTRIMDQSIEIELCRLRNDLINFDYDLRILNHLINKRYGNNEQ